MERLLIISVSPLKRDPRVLRQIALFQEDYEVVTMGYGDRPEGVERHIRLPEPHRTTYPQKVLKALMSTLGRYDWLYSHLPGINAAKAWLDTHQDDYDAILTNDLAPVPAAVATEKPVHADLHEYALGQHSSWTWKLFQAPLMRYCASSLKRVRSRSTVSAGIGRLYDEELGGKTEVVASGPYYRSDLAPTGTGRPIRLVHMGVARENRSLERYIEAARMVNAESPGSITLDLYLMPIRPEHIDELKDQAGDPGVTGVRICDPVPFDEMVDTLHQYDVAVVFFPPNTLNLRYVLPNKFFEAIQARIGVITGPSEELTPYLDKYGIGTATNGWNSSDLAETMSELSSGQVNEWKRNADVAAKELSAEKQDHVWEGLVAGLFT